MEYTKENFLRRRSIAEWLARELRDLINDVRQTDKSDMPAFNKGFEVKCAIDAKVAKILKKMPVSDLHEALKAIDGYLSASFPANLTRKKHAVELLDQALAKVEGK